MNNWSHIISAGVGPIIVISACGLLCLALYNRLAGVVSRLRSFQRERLREQEALARLRAARSEDRIALVHHEGVLAMLNGQTERVIWRARLLRMTLYCLLGTIGLLALCSLAVGLGVVWPSAMYLAVPLFVAGLVLLVLGVGLAIAELRAALDPVVRESQLVSQLSRALAEGRRPHAAPQADPLEQPPGLS